MHGVDAVGGESRNHAGELATGAAHHANADFGCVVDIQPAVDALGRRSELLLLRGAGEDLGGGAGAGGAVVVDVVFLAFSVDKRCVAAKQDAQGVVEVLLGGAVVQGQPVGGPPAGGDAEVGQGQWVAVDALVGVFGDEDVVRSRRDAGAEEVPVAGVEVLGFVDNDVLEHGLATTLATHVQDLGADGGHGGPEELAVDGLGVHDRFEHRPDLFALLAVQWGAAAGAGDFQILSLGRDPVRQDDGFVFGLEEGVVSYLARHGLVGAFDGGVPHVASGEVGVGADV